MNRFLAGVGVLAMLVCIGCQEPKYYPVSGVVVDDQGLPLKELSGASVVFEAVDQPVSAVGEIGNDGSFAMSSEIADDGCIVGEHRVAIGLIFRDGDGPQVKILDPKYESTETSPLKVTVEKEANRVRLQVERFRKPEAE